ncbi:glycosyl hydrolase family 28 protein [Occallatibacter savannae]|uniref:glycosyl hydrolase family 28 protein n=1 Tax=Occallatibacter savannae TaxID=1002691 RepID=UPI0013A59B70|nr:glycosyl hydrolase family 28 protein [Occallatibacter savannae]
MRIRFAGLVVVLFSSPLFCMAQASPGTQCPDHPEDLFTVAVNSSDVAMHATDVGSFAIFPLVLQSNISIHAGFDVRWVEVRPLSAKIHATIAPNHRDLAFTISDTTPLTVEFNNDLAHVVHLFPHAPEEDSVERSSGRLRYFGPGVHEAGVIELRTGETVYLAAGAWVKGAIRARGVRDVAIRGFGVLDGSTITESEAPYGGRSPIYLEDTQNAWIEGITVVNSQDWTVHLHHANGSHINGIKVLNPGSRYGDDGLDLVSSSHVVVENVFIRTNDDCVVVKNLADLETSDVTVRHSVLWNMPRGGNGIEIGFETRSHATHDIRFQDLDLIHIERGAAISIHNGDSAAVENIDYDDIRVEDVRRKLIDLAVVYAPYGPDRPVDDKEIHERMDRGGTWDAALCYRAQEKGQLSRRRGTIRGIRVRNLQVVSGLLPYSVIAGYDGDHAVSQVEMQGMEYQGRKLTTADALKLVQEYASGIVIR